MVKDRLKRICYIIDVAIPLDVNIPVKQAEKLLKYKDLQIQLQRLWDMKVVIVPIIIGALGTFGKDHGKYLQLIPGCDSQYLSINLQETVLMETCRIIRKVL